MTGILLASDSDALYNQVDASLAGEGTEVWRIRNGSDVVETVGAKEPDLVLLDLQIGNMGGVAACLALRQEEGFDRLDRRPIILLLDREVDRFLAGEAGADDVLVKPISPIALRRAVDRLLAAGAASD